MDPRTLVRPHLRTFTPYASARDEFSGTASIFLDANENPLGSVGSELLNRYPDPHQTSLKHKLAELKGLSPDDIFVGHGSDEIIDLLLRLFCEPGEDEVILFPPTYGMYSVAAQLQNLTVTEIPLDEHFRIDVERTRASVSSHSKLLFVCSPNNPTANLVSREALEALLSFFPGIVVVDEAYIEFSPQNSALSLLPRYPNLVVTQTLSKAWGLAGLRIGFGFGHPSIIKFLDRIKSPYNVSEIALRLAERALDNVAEKDRMVFELLLQRKRLEQELSAIAVVEHVYPSDANFLLVRVRDAVGTYRKLLEAGIVVRDRSSVPGCERCLRISVGSASENEKLIQTLLGI